MSQFVHITFHDKADGGCFNRPPPCARNPGFGGQIFELVAAAQVRELGSAAKFRRFGSGLGAPPFGDGSGRAAMTPSKNVAVFVDGAAEAVIGCRTIEVMRHVVLARPDELDGPAWKFLCDL